MAIKRSRSAILVIGLLVLVASAPIGRTQSNNKPMVQSLLSRPPYAVQSITNISDRGKFHRYEIRLLRDGQPYWTIGPEDLKVNEGECFAVDSPLCKDIHPPDFTCYAPCLHYGPEYLVLDEQSQKIYLQARANTGKDAQRFLFIGDITAKRIQYLRWIGGPPGSGVISPGGQYLAIHGLGMVQILDLEANHVEVISDWSGKLYPVGSYTEANWLGDDRLQVSLKETSGRTLERQTYSLRVKDQTLIILKN